ncbi:MAG: imelysin family protein [Litorilituus sp.]|nr:imelysin family protein [Litorilituus sp.]
MTHFNKLPAYKVISPLLLTFALSACGGGGSDSTTPTTPTPTTPTSTDTAQFTLWLTDLANNYILPSYQDLQTKAQALATQSSHFCTIDNASNADLQTLQQSWVDFNTSWQDIQWLKVGPVLESSRLFRIQFWPDSNDAVGRGIDALLTETETLTADLVAGVNVGGQGIPALEILLFTETSQNSLLLATNKAKRCEAVQAISDNLVNITTDINTEWASTGGNYVASLIGGQDDFTSIKDAVEELITNWLEFVEKVKDEKLLEPLAVNAPGIPTIAEFVLSDKSLVSIKVNAMAISKIFSANNGHGFDNILIEHFEQQAISNDITAKITAITTAVDALDTSMSFEQLLNDEHSRLQLTKLIQKIRELRDVITADFVQATDINIGFNSNDGD